MEFILAYDLGTGGIKASLFDKTGNSAAECFAEYQTFYDKADFQEQCPQDWWDCMISATRELLQKSEVDAADIKSIGVSGHSLGVVAVDEDGRLLSNRTPIWSDARAASEADDFFERVDSSEWYLETGGGFPPPLYSIFKIMWYQKHDPALYEKAAYFIGTKDYINVCLTGTIATDHSYASGSGVYSLQGHAYEERYIEASGIDPQKLPPIFESTQVLGTLKKDAAAQLGLCEKTYVVCGGVDNACMALGADCFEDGKAYTSLGTSAWIAVSSSKPILNLEKRPYVFAHCIDGQYVSATCIFSAGRTLQWARDVLCQNLVIEGRKSNKNAYRLMDELAALSPIGANHLLFNPSLSGGSSLDKSLNLRGSFVGLDLSHTQGDLIRAILEGVALNLRGALDVLQEFASISDEMLLVGGGGNSPLWRQIFANAYHQSIIQTNVGQNAGSLGAAALAAVGIGLWKDFSPIHRLHHVVDIKTPQENAAEQYEKMAVIAKAISDFHSEIGDKMSL